MKKVIFLSLICLGTVAAGFSQSSTATIVTKLYKNQKLEKNVRADKKIEYTLTKDIEEITEDVYNKGAVMVYIRAANSNENYQALPFTNIYNRLYAYSYIAQSLTIVSNFDDNLIDVKVVILKN